ncbi:MAG: hypothetical protein DRP97_03560 [Candidatus Latescibacterota bacterium]|nr:MAG: hypothetical protein DRP97_03560 [Candidatus Latescibacterota bacterium]
MPYKNNQLVPDGNFCEISTRRNGKKVACKYCNIATRRCEKYDELLEIKYQLINHIREMFLEKCEACADDDKRKSK